MRVLGFLILAVGVALLIYAGINYYRTNRQLKSPIPQDQGIKVIFVTPPK